MQRPIVNRRAVEPPSRRAVEPPSRRLDGMKVDNIKFQEDRFVFPDVHRVFV